MTFYRVSHHFLGMPMYRTNLVDENFQFTNDNQWMVCLKGKWEEIEEVIVLRTKIWFIKADEILVEINHSELLWQKLLPIIQRHQAPIEILPKK